MTPKQEAYCHAVADGLEPIEAAKKAGYNPQHITRQVYRLENNTSVQHRIAELKAVKHIQSKHREGKPVKVDSQPNLVQEKIKALDFLNDTYNDLTQPMKVRVQAAVAALPYEEAKVPAVGKKETVKDNAKKATTSGKFATLSNQPDMLEASNIQ